jgi:hypothetical protein
LIYLSANPWCLPDCHPVGPFKFAAFLIIPLVELPETSKLSSSRTLTLRNKYTKAYSQLRISQFENHLRLSYFTPSKNHFAQILYTYSASLS